MFGAFGKAGSAHSIAFVNKASITPLFLFHGFVHKQHETYAGLFRFSSKFTSHVVLSHAGSFGQWGKSFVWT